MPPSQRRAPETPVTDAALDAAFGPQECRPVEMPDQVATDAEAYRAQLLERMRRGVPSIIARPDGGTMEYIPPRNVHTQLAAFQANLPKIQAAEEAKVKPKDGGAGYSYAYAGLDTVADRVLKGLGAVGLAWVTVPTMTERGMVLRYELVHGESGTKIEGVWPLAGDTRNPQAMGSAITYARRYCLLSVSGCFPGGEDDDGSAAKAHAERERMNSNNDAWRGHQSRSNAQQEQRELERSVNRARQAAQPTNQRPREEPQPVADMATAGYPGADEAGDEPSAEARIGLESLATLLHGDEDDPYALILRAASDYLELTDEELDTEISPEDTEDARVHGRTCRGLWATRVERAITNASTLDILSNTYRAVKRSGMEEEWKPKLMAKKTELEAKQQ